MKSIIKAMLIITTSAAAIMSAEAQPITIIIKNVRSDNGNIMVMARIPDVKDPVYKMAPAKKGEVSVEIDDIGGNSAEISLFHDENGNYQLDMGDRGPTEGYATKKCRLESDSTSLRFNLYYPPQNE